MASWSCSPPCSPLWVPWLSQRRCLSWCAPYIGHFQLCTKCIALLHHIKCIADLQWLPNTVVSPSSQTVFLVLIMRDHWFDPFEGNIYLSLTSGFSPVNVEQLTTVLDTRTGSGYYSGILEALFNYERRSIFIFAFFTVTSVLVRARRGRYILKPEICRTWTQLIRGGSGEYSFIMLHSSIQLNSAWRNH